MPTKGKLVKLDTKKKFLDGGGIARQQDVEATQEATYYIYDFSESQNRINRQPMTYNEVLEYYKDNPNIQVRPSNLNYDDSLRANILSKIQAGYDKTDIINAGLVSEQGYNELLPESEYPRAHQVYAIDNQDARDIRARAVTSDLPADKVGPYLQRVYRKLEDPNVTLESLVAAGTGDTRGLLNLIEGIEDFNKIEIVGPLKGTEADTEAFRNEMYVAQREVTEAENNYNLAKERYDQHLQTAGGQYSNGELLPNDYNHPDVIAFQQAEENLNAVKNRHSESFNIYDNSVKEASSNLIADVLVNPTESNMKSLNDLGFDTEQISEITGAYSTFQDEYNNSLTDWNREQLVKSFGQAFDGFLNEDQLGQLINPVVDNADEITTAYSLDNETRGQLLNKGVVLNPEQEANYARAQEQHLAAINTYYDNKAQEDLYDMSSPVDNTYVASIPEPKKQGKLTFNYDPITGNTSTSYAYDSEGTDYGPMADFYLDQMKEIEQTGLTQFNNLNFFDRENARRAALEWRAYNNPSQYLASTKAGLQLTPSGTSAVGGGYADLTAEVDSYFDELKSTKTSRDIDKFFQGFGTLGQGLSYTGNPFGVVVGQGIAGLSDAALTLNALASGNPTAAAAYGFATVNPFVSGAMVSPVTRFAASKLDNLYKVPYLGTFTSNIGKGYNYGKNKFTNLLDSKLLPGVGLTTRGALRGTELAADTFVSDSSAAGISAVANQDLSQALVGAGYLGKEEEEAEGGGLAREAQLNVNTNLDDLANLAIEGQTSIASNLPTDPGTPQAQEIDLSGSSYEQFKAENNPYLFSPEAGMNLENIDAGRASEFTRGELESQGYTFDDTVPSEPIYTEPSGQLLFSPSQFTNQNVIRQQDAGKIGPAKRYRTTPEYLESQGEKAKSFLTNWYGNRILFSPEQGAVDDFNKARDYLVESAQNLPTPQAYPENVPGYNDPNLSGRYMYNQGPRIYINPIHDKNTILHESVHAAQQGYAGPAINQVNSFAVSRALMPQQDLYRRLESAGYDMSSPEMKNYVNYYLGSDGEEVSAGIMTARYYYPDIFKPGEKVGAQTIQAFKERYIEDVKQNKEFIPNIENLFNFFDDKGLQILFNEIVRNEPQQKEQSKDLMVMDFKKDAPQAFASGGTVDRHQSLSDAWKGLKNMAEDATEAVTDAYDYTSEKASDAYDYASDKASDAYDYTSEKASDAYDYTSDKVSDAYDYTSDKVSDVGEYITDEAEDLWESSYPGQASQEFKELQTSGAQQDIGKIIMSDPSLTLQEALDKAGYDKSAYLMDYTQYAPFGEKYIPEDAREFSRLRNHTGLELMQDPWFKAKYGDQIQQEVNKQIVEAIVPKIKDYAKNIDFSMPDLSGIFRKQAGGLFQNPISSALDSFKQVGNDMVTQGLNSALDNTMESTYGYNFIGQGSGRICPPEIIFDFINNGDRSFSDVLVSSDGVFDVNYKKNNPVIVPTEDGVITMEGVEMDLVGVSDLGEVKYMPSNSGLYQFEGKNIVEYPSQIFYGKDGGLADWFKEEWVRIDTEGNITGPCGTMKKGKATTRCLPKKKAQSLSKAQRAATARKKVRGSKKGKQFVKNTKEAKVTKKDTKRGS